MRERTSEIINQTKTSKYIDYLGIDEELIRI